jgi:hypothetical protein
MGVNGFEDICSTVDHGNGTPGRAGKPTKVFPREGVPLPVRCSTGTLTGSITVAEGVFAPGHLGGLTWQVPFGLVDDILMRSRTVQTRLRLLPSRSCLQSGVTACR